MSGGVTNIENILEKTAVIAPSLRDFIHDNYGGGLIPVDTGYDREKRKQTQMEKQCNVSQVFSHFQLRPMIGGRGWVHVEFSCCATR